MSRASFFVCFLLLTTVFVARAAAETFALRARPCAGGAEVYGVDGEIVGAELVIPETIAITTDAGARLDAPVVKIGAEAFMDDGYLTSVVLPKGLTEIDDRAFAHCVSLREVAFPRGLKRIGAEAFALCYGFRSLTFPEGLTELGDGAFASCLSLETLELPGGPTKLGAGVFSGCPRVKRVALAADSPSYQIVDDVLFSKDGRTLVWYFPYKTASAYVAPSGVEEIAPQAFANAQALETLVLSEGTTTIGDLAFFRCQGLVSIAIPNSATCLGERVFDGCSALEKIALAGDNPNLKLLDGVLFSKDGRRLVYCLSREKIEEYDVPSDVVEISGGAFSDSGFLKRIAFPSGLKRIGENAFFACSSLESVVIPEGATLESAAFVLCMSLTSVELPEGTAEIPERAFSACHRLTSIKIPSGATKIGVGAFADCVSLESVALPEGLIEIGAFAFRNCGALERITLPASATRVDERAFPDETIVLRAE